MPNTRAPRSESTRDAERACRHRRQDAIAVLRMLLANIPREQLHGYLYFTDPHAVLPRYGIPEAHAIKIAIAIIMYVCPSVSTIT
jgi:hypothetical protein